MPKKSAYIFLNGTLKRKGNTIYFEGKNEEKRVIKTTLPIKSISELFIFGEVSFNKTFLKFLSQEKVLLHFFDKFNKYFGTFFPAKENLSGKLLVLQVKFYLDEKKRFFLAQKFVEGAIKNMLYVLRVYKSRGAEVEEGIKDIIEILERIINTKSISQLMSYEGQAKGVYYQQFNKILQKEEFKFVTRSIRPPEDRINALISFGNSLLYSVILSEIFHTKLDPRIAFLHESNERAFSLNLDIAEIFKPLLVDRTILSVINKGEIKKEDFEEKERIVYLKKKGVKKLVKEFNKRLETTVNIPRMKRSLSYRTLIREECYKLCRHLEGKEEYKPFIRTR